MSEKKGSDFDENYCLVFFQKNHGFDLYTIVTHNHVRTPTLTFISTRFPHTVLEAVVFDDEVINSREIADLLPKLKSKEICVAFPKSKSSVAVYKSISKKHKLVFKHAGGTFPEFYKHVSEKWCRRTRGTYIECTVGIVRNRETYRNLLKMDQVLTVSELNLILN